MPKAVLCSTGALITRYNGRDPRLLERIAPYIACDGFELMVYPSWYEGDKLAVYTDFLRGCGLPFPVLHADKSVGELLSVGGEENIAEARGRFLTCCRVGQAVGSKLMVLHLWGGPASDYHIERNIEELDGFTKLAAEHGILLTVENVVCAKRTPLENIKAVLEVCPEAVFTIDTKMAEFHGELKAELDYYPLFGGGHTAHLHVNDYGGGIRDFSDLRVLHIGQGHVDFASFFEKVRACGYEGSATVEATSVRPDGSIAFDMLNSSLARVRRGLFSD